MKRLQTFNVILLWAGLASGLGQAGARAGYLQNPSFEANYNDSFPHYGSIDAWTGGSGVNESGGPFHNGGTAIPDQLRVAFIQGPDKTLSQDITGLVAGKRYWIQFFYDARACCGGTIDLATKLNDVQLDNITNVKPAANPAAYYFRSVEFTAEGDAGTLSFVTAGSGDATINLDSVTIVQRDLGNVVLRNPSFEASGDVVEGGDVLPIGGWQVTGDARVGGADNGAIPDQDHVARLSGESAVTQRAANLVIGKPYELRVAYNAATGSRPHLQIKVNGAVLFEEDVTPVGGAAAFRTRSVTFTAADITAEISVAQSKAGSDVLLVDDVRLLGETGRELAPVAVAPASAEMSAGEQLDFTVTLPAELLATKAAEIVVQSSASSVLRFVDASGALLTRSILRFAQGGANVQSIKVQALARGSAVFQVVDAAGLKVANQPAITVIAARLKNPSFESTPVPAGVGYGAIAGWTGGSGLNAAPGPFSDNGVIPDRKQVGFQQGAGTLAQEVRGLAPGKNHWLQFFYNVRNGSTMDVSVRLGGQELTKLTAVTPAGEGVPYSFRHLEFTPTTPTALLEFVTTPTGDSTFLLDGVTIVQRDPGQIAVRNPSFEASGSVYPFPGYFDAIAGWDVGGGGRGVNIDGAGPFTDNGRAGDQDLVLFMQGNGSFVSQTLSGLTAGRKYIVGFLVNGRLCCGPEENSYMVSVDEAPILEEVFMPVGGANRYLVKQAEFVATAAEAMLKFQGTTPAGDHTILIDNVVVLPDANSKPVILAHPAATAVAVGESVTLTSGAVGSGALSYQWMKDGQPVTGQASDTLTLETVAAGAAGHYHVDVRNAAGVVSSAVARLTILEPIPGIYDTGVDNNRTVLNDAAVDPHYVLVKNADAAASRQAFVQDSSKWPLVAGPWFANNDLSKWIGPRVDPGTESPLGGPAGGDYVFRQTIDLTGFDAGTAVLSGGWAADNSVELIINELATGVTVAGFGGLGAFTVTGVFKPGVNLIDFKVNNGDASGGPSGLRVEGLKLLGAKSGQSNGGGAPSLQVTRSGGNLTISWPSSFAGFTLESAASVRGPWERVAGNPEATADSFRVNIAIGAGARFHRLRK